MFFKELIIKEITNMNRVLGIRIQIQRITYEVNYEREYFKIWKSDFKELLIK